ncbi:VOC family protein [Sulfuriflexus sp.]|uniref:VOC family protein n=1 Tax=Sulfuriflexus sp. TaxID=2015443 RepID=UPI0028CCE0BC|nr:VOC family protein [Sulfuriflexus sp.]MDT8405054.1 VOC family protein [Sulfuriflexus sp.]
MKIKTTVLCLPVTDLQKTLGFYQGVFGFSDAQIEEGILALEFPNMSLFLMEKASYESYTRKADRAALMPGASAPAVISCAVETHQDVDHAMETAKHHGGGAPGVAAVDATSGGYTGYVTDPEGHLWELVCPNQQ